LILFVHKSNFCIVAQIIAFSQRLIALRITDSRDRQPLEQFVQDYIVAGSLVASDKWWAYDELELLGYAHS